MSSQQHTRGDIREDSMVIMERPHSMNHTQSFTSEDIERDIEGSEAEEYYYEVIVCSFINKIIN